MTVRHLLLQLQPGGPDALPWRGRSRQSQGLLLQEGARAAGGRGRKGGGGVKVGVTWQSGSEITRTPRQGSSA